VLAASRRSVSARSPPIRSPRSDRSVCDAERARLCRGAGMSSLYSGGPAFSAPRALLRGSGIGCDRRSDHGCRLATRRNSRKNGSGRRAQSAHGGRTCWRDGRVYSAPRDASPDRGFGQPQGYARSGRRAAAFDRSFGQVVAALPMLRGNAAAWLEASWRAVSRGVSRSRAQAGMGGWVVCRGSCAAADDSEPGRLSTRLRPLFLAV
jgi:hypothetical protein